MSGEVAASEAPPRRIFGLDRNVFFLGVVSFLTDLSSEMTLTVLPLFLSNVLGAGTALIGVIEGFAETVSSLTRIPSGWISDRFGRRKPLTLVGYGLSAVSKPFLYFASAWVPVLAIRTADRLGKGIRTAPRDALIADSSPPESKGLSFGFHRAADTAGALLGLGLVALVVFLVQGGELKLERNTYQVLVLVGLVPGLGAVAVLAGLVKERKKVQAKGPAAGSLRGSFSLLDSRFRWYVAIVFVFTLGNSADAFLILRAQNLGFSILHIALLLVMFNTLYAAVSTPAGALSDRIGRRRLLLAGWALYALVYLGFALAGAGWQVWLLWAGYGLYYALAEGAARAFVADLVPATVRGTAYGVYNGAVGLAALPASLLAGVLWQGAFGWKGLGPAAPFFAGAILAGLASLALAVWLPLAGRATPAPSTGGAAAAS